MRVPMWIMLAAASSLVGCDDGETIFIGRPDVLPDVICSGGEARACPCTDGSSGEQSCVAGSTWSDCACALPDTDVSSGDAAAAVDDLDTVPGDADADDVDALQGDADTDDLDSVQGDVDVNSDIDGDAEAGPDGDADTADDGCDPTCGGATPFCKSSSCVQCLNDSHCEPGAKCNAAGNCQVENQGCLDPKPFFWEGKCVACLNNTHCATGYCAAATHTCEDSGGVCSSCTGSYPACAEVGGEFFCVPCTDDSYCLSGCTCDTSSYTCEGNCDADTLKCKSDADCDPGITGFDLTCELSTGLCVDSSGGCDDITAFCKGGGKCVNILDAFGGAGGGLPIPLPGAGDGGTPTLPGGCECDGLTELTSPPDKKVCGSSGLCFGFSALLGTGSDFCTSSGF